MVFFSDDEDDDPQPRVVTYESLVDTGPTEPYVTLSYLRSINWIVYTPPVFTAAEQSAFVDEFREHEGDNDEDFQRWCIDLVPPRFWIVTSDRRLPCKAAYIVFNPATQSTIRFTRFDEDEDDLFIGVSPHHFSSFAMGVDSICPKKLLRLSLQGNTEKTAEQCRAIMRIIFGVNRPLLIPEVELTLDVKPHNLPSVLSEICYCETIEFSLNSRYTGHYPLVESLKAMRRMEHIKIPCKYFDDDKETWTLALKELLQGNQIIQSLGFRLSVQWLSDRDDVNFFTAVLSTVKEHKVKKHQHTKKFIIFFGLEYQSYKFANDQQLVENCRRFLKRQRMLNPDFEVVFT